jgi:antitoxin (DNA-binding transcriptional repressor) of toxin-antitoxin stability system
MNDVDQKLAQLIAGLQPGEAITLVLGDRPVARIIPEGAARRKAGACKGMLMENPEVPDDIHLEDFKDYM